MQVTGCKLHLIRIYYIMIHGKARYSYIKRMIKESPTRVKIASSEYIQSMSNSKMNG